MCLWDGKKRKQWHTSVSSLLLPLIRITALQIKATLFKIQTHTLGNQSSSSVFYAVFGVSTSSPRPHSTHLKSLQLFWAERCWLCCVFNIPRSASSLPVSPSQWSSAGNSPSLSTGNEATKYSKTLNFLGGRQNIPEGAAGRYSQERGGCVLSLFLAICGWPLTALLANAPLLWLQSLLVFLFSERYPGPENRSLNSCTSTAEDS